MSTLINNNDAGMASLVTEDFRNVALQTGDTPITTTPEVVDDSLLAAGVPALTVVGRNSGGKLVLAQNGSVAAIGVTTAALLPNSTVGNVAIIRSGMLNPDALNWHASYDTDEKKRLAFETTQDTLFIRKPGYPIA